MAALGILDQPYNILSDPARAMWGPIVANVWFGIPFFAITLLAALQAIPAELYEAAAIDGANPWQRFLAVTLPFLAPAIAITVLLRTIWIANFADLIWVMTNGGPANATQTLATYIFSTAYSKLDFGYASAVAAVMLLLLLLYSVVLLRFAAACCRPAEDPPDGHGRARPVAASRRWTGHRLALACYLAFALFPLYWLVKIAISPNKLLYKEGTAQWPSQTTLANFGFVLLKSEFPRFFLNSVIVSLGTVVQVQHHRLRRAELGLGPRPHREWLVTEPIGHRDGHHAHREQVVLLGVAGTDHALGRFLDDGLTEQMGDRHRSAAGRPAPVLRDEHPAERRTPADRGDPGSTCELQESPSIPSLPSRESIAFLARTCAAALGPLSPAACRRPGSPGPDRSCRPSSARCRRPPSWRPPSRRRTPGPRNRLRDGRFGGRSPRP